MKIGNIIFNFSDIPNEMKTATNDYFDNNDINPLSRFIDEKIEFVDDETNRIKREEFREIFNNWCKMNDLPRNNSTNKNFTTELKKYNISSKESLLFKYSV
jgi:hypothetical protein